MIVCAGEALVDLLPLPGGGDPSVLRAAVGGAPFNVARGLGRLGLRVGFLGAVSTDAFGDRIMAALRESGVEAELVARVARPTPLAVVTLDGPEARYAFYDRGTAARGMTLRELPPLPDNARLLHFGSIALVAEPAAATMMARARVAGADRLVSCDPNVRPEFAPDPAIYRRNLDQAMRLAHIVRLSAADLAWLRPGLAAADFAAERLADGARLVVVTRAADGAVGFTRGGSVEVPAVPVRVADSIGAGDAFTAGLLAALTEAGVAHPADLDRLDSDRLGAALGFAARVAAAACTRPGADPPRRAELPAAP